MELVEFPGIQVNLDIPVSVDILAGQDTRVFLELVGHLVGQVKVDTRVQVDGLVGVEYLGLKVIREI